ncbi:MAG: hypothetical protein HC935_04330 [Pseudanabaena sp. SU_2_4]|nr:hypothetical protein [Pseudanabaena sp. SU_2_4]
MLLYLYQFQLRISATRAIAPHIFKLKISSAVSINSGRTGDRKSPLPEPQTVTTIAAI